MKNLAKKFISIISPHLKGKKAYFDLLSSIKKNKKIDPNKIVTSSIYIIKPGLKLIKKVKSGTLKYIPSFLTHANAYYFSINWLVKAAQNLNRNMSFSTKLTTEVLNTLNKQSLAYKYKKDYDTQLKDNRDKVKRKYRRQKKNKKKLYSFVKRPFTKRKLRKRYRSRKKKAKQKAMTNFFVEDIEDVKNVENVEDIENIIKTKDKIKSLFNLKIFLKELKLNFPQENTNGPLKTTKKTIESYFSFIKKNSNIPNKSNIWLRDNIIRQNHFSSLLLSNIIYMKTIDKKRKIKRIRYLLRDFIARRFRYFKRAL